MGTVTIQLPPAPAYVRTARLVVAAMARRHGLKFIVRLVKMDEIRLAVGEACARAVHVQVLEGITTPITIEMSDDAGFAVTITDRATAVAVSSPGRGGFPDRWGVREPAPIVGLAILTAVVDDVQVTAATPHGTRVHVRWPVGPDV